MYGNLSQKIAHQIVPDFKTLTLTRKYTPYFQSNGSFTSYQGQI
jgi:hypothetical protein